MSDIPTVLMFNIPDTKKRRVRAILAALKIGGREVPQEEQWRTVASLLEEPENTRPDVGNSKCFQDEMLVIHALSEKQMDCFLREIRAENAGVGLKAVTTPMNVLWSCTELHDALRREHEAFRKMRGK